VLLGSGNQQLAPLYRDDVVETILHAALDTETPIGAFQFAGPDTMTAEQFVRLLNSDSIRIHRTPVTLARLLGHVIPTLTPSLLTSCSVTQSQLRT
jgi:NAD dependent epimerase/dehydratase family enzyme